MKDESSRDNVVVCHVSTIHHGSGLRILWKKRASLASARDKDLSSMDWLQVLCVKSKHKHAYHEYTIKVLAERRAVIQETMTQASIRTEVWYPESVYQQPCFERKQELLDEPLNVDPVVLGVLSFLMSLSLKDGDRREVVLTTKESATEAIR